MYHCNSCGKGFSSETGVAQHAQAKNHTYIRAPLRQTVAPAARLAPAPAPAPIPVPTASTQYKCDMCDATFTSEALLRAHFKESTRHPSCSRCQESFKDLHTLSKVCSRLSYIASGSDVSRAAYCVCSSLVYRKGTNICFDNASNYSEAIAKSNSVRNFEHGIVEFSVEDLGRVSSPYHQMHDLRQALLRYATAL